MDDLAVAVIAAVVAGLLALNVAAIRHYSTLRIRIGQVSDDSPPIDIGGDKTLKGLDARRARSLVLAAAREAAFPPTLASYRGLDRV